MGQTLTEKIIARAAGVPHVSPGEIVGVEVDRLMINDALAPTVITKFESLGVEDVVHPERILVCLDHKAPPENVAVADSYCRIRAFCRKHGMDGFLEIGRHGIGHQVMCEGFTRPGEVAVGTDSHAPMYGGMGALGCGINASDAAVALATGKIWMCVPEAVQVVLTGRLRPGCTAKDLSLRMLNLDDTETFLYRNLEVVGPGVRTLSAGQRMTIANMAAEMDVKACIVEPDETIAAYLGDGAGCDIRADEDAVYAKTFTVDLDQIEPLIACPHSNHNVRPVREVRGLQVDQVVLGSCTNGRLEDLIQAAQVIGQRKIHPNVRMLVIPASQKVFTEATAMGVTETLLRAGATFVTPSCAACGANGPGKLGAGERCVSTTNRNFKGRIGSTESEVFLASPYTAAATALAGHIESADRYLEGGEP